MYSRSKRTLFHKIHDKSRIFGLTAVVREVVRRKFGFAIPTFETCAPLVRGKSGLEIGGPSKIFSRGDRFPVYPIVGRLDNCNFAATTYWGGTMLDRQAYTYDRQRPPGIHYIREGIELKGIRSESYDFVLSSHTLEHIANPIRALREWLRVLKVGGTLVLILPHKDGMFDHRRPVTKLSHLMEDFNRGTKEDDLTHLPEILELHDLGQDREAGTIEQFRQRSLANFTNRALHHHVFTTEFVVEILDFLGLQIITVYNALYFDIISIALKLHNRERADNSSFFGRNADFRAHSPFPSDRN